jgi:hypothetical protein
MKLKWLILLIPILLGVEIVLGQESDDLSTNMISFKVSSIDNVSSKRLFIIEGRETLSNDIIVIFSERSDSLSCENWERMMIGKEYNLPLEKIFITPFHIGNDSLAIMFDNREVVVTMFGYSFTRNFLPYSSESIIRDKVCIKPIE